MPAGHGCTDIGGLRGFIAMLGTSEGRFLAPIVVVYAITNAAWRFLGWK